MIYLDNAASTPLLKYNVKEILGNPSSPHALGIAAEKNLNQARKQLSSILKCLSSEVVFTSGGTESNNLAIIGLAMANRRKSITFFAQPWEHPSVLEPLKFVKEQGLADITLAPYEDWVSRTTTSTPIAIISHVNHETGDINDITAIAATLKQKYPQAVMIVDGAQGFCKEPLNLFNIDIYTFSGHKFHAPTGTGGLMKRNNIRLTPLFYGGGQENKLRPGTENVNAIAQMARTAETLTNNFANNHAHVSAIKSTLVEICHILPYAHINSLHTISPYILNMSFTGLKGEVLVHALSKKGIYTSMGAACKSRKNSKTSLEAMGFSRERAESAIRFSFSHMNTIEEVVAAKAAIVECVQSLRQII